MTELGMCEGGDKRYVSDVGVESRAGFTEASSLRFDHGHQRFVLFSGLG